MSVTPLFRDVTRTVPDVDIVIPVHNEAEQLATSITTLRAYLESSFPFVTSITIADNASTDDTWGIATALADDLPRVRAIHLDRKGRGRALRKAWSTSDASVVAYMDVDLATGLDALLPLVAPLLSGHSDVAIGTRLAPGAHVVRGARRELISRGYNLLLRTALRSSCTDAQCGFKALGRDVADELLPLVEDNEWFFDTEVLITAQRIGLRIHEVPVDWVDDTDSRVEVARTAWKDLQGVARMLGPAARERVLTRTARPVGGRVADIGGAPRGDWCDTSWSAPSAPLETVSSWPSGAGRPDQVFADELLRFAGVGAVSTAAYLALFALLERGLGTYLANSVAIGLCSLGNTTAHRGMAGTVRHGLDRRHRLVTAAALLGVSLAFTTGALAATRAAGLTGLAPELAAVTVANIAAAVFRFAILRTWVFRPQFGTHLPPVAGELGRGGDAGTDGNRAGGHETHPTTMTRTHS
ncbi:MAG: glycosyltransferase [Acidimicrobiales bacterium]